MICIIPKYNIDQWRRLIFYLYEIMLLAMKVTLTFNEKQELLAQHWTTRDGRVRDRIKSVIHASNGWSPAEIADALLIHESTVRQHLKDYQNQKKLKPENGGSQSYLNYEQTQELVAHLTTQTYHYSYQIVSTLSRLIIFSSLYQG